jgi:enediyne biosynthesis protein E4
MTKRPDIFLLLGVFTMLLIGCGDKKNKPGLFEALEESRTGLHFANKLTPTKEFNMFNYMYFYNGAGTAAGDFNNDGLIDLFFSSNQGENKLYLNKGKLSFTDVTKETRIPQDGGWSTGVSLIDINNDGLLDIYICKVGKYEVLNSKNQFLVCKGIGANGIPFYEDEAAKYGLDFSGLSTQALFFDYDMDGDLDMFLLNHSVHQNGSFAPRSAFKDVYNPLSGDRIFQNQGASFIDVTRQTGINSSSISYGLGVATSDINLDGWPDLYAGNDFHENDYLYINRKNGTFAEETEQRLMHTSKYTMGVDVADINNDGYPEIISTDMLPADPLILKSSLGDDDYDVFYQKIFAGYNYQYSRNNLQYNRKNGLFSEVGMYAGIYATDWSWSPLWVDFDNDGLKDLFISNGIPKRLNDMDYINFISNEEIQQKLRENKMDEKNLTLVDKFPEVKIPNKFFKNTGNLLFSDLADTISNNKASYSNSVIYADLDNDGDLDIVTNNIDEPVLLYENKSNDKKEKTYVDIKLKGPEKNINALSAKIVLFTTTGIQVYENNPVKGFQSSMQVPVHIGLHNVTIDSAFLIWPDNTCQPIQLQANHQQTFSYTTNLPLFNYTKITGFQKSSTWPIEDITDAVQLTYKHTENLFVEFDREPLIPHMISTEGPALAVSDINNDGLQDVFIGASKSFHNAIFLQQPGGIFLHTQQPALLADSTYEDVDATWTDVNKDGYADLVIAGGGNQYYGQDKYMLPRVYLNDGKAQFKRSEDAITNIFITASCVAPYDFNGDGFVDLFIGGRSVAWEYGKMPNSYLLLNDGSGRFTDVTQQYAKEVSKVGMVTQALWFDIDKDGDKDLLICCEWGGIVAFMNNKGTFSKKILTAKQGWWNFILPYDTDGDGDIDLIAGNLGLNSRLKASDQTPVKMYYNDYDDNGKSEQLLTYFLGNKEVLFASKGELQTQMPGLKKKFLYAEDFAKSPLDEVVPKEKLKAAETYTANYFSNAILVNDGNMNFTLKPLPWQAQLSNLRDAVPVQANNDSLPDFLLAGNYYDNNIQMGRSDADFGTILVNKGNNNFTCETLNGLAIKGQIRHIREISINNQPAYIMARNNDSTMVLRFHK